MPRVLTLTAAVAVAAGCRSDPTSAGASAGPVRPEWVVGEAQKALGPDGRFVFERPGFRAASPERADSVARADVRFLTDAYGAVSTGGPYSDARGGQPLRFGELRPCARAYYVRGALAPLPDTVPLYVRQYYGPRYAVPLCDAHGEAELSDDVADAPPVVVIRGGTFVVPWWNGSEFSSSGIPLMADAGLPVSPEQAVGFAAQATGRRVARVPEALANFPDGFARGLYPSLCMRWHLVLDAPVVLTRASGARDTTAEVYVSRQAPCFHGALALWVPVAGQSVTRTVRFVLVPPAAGQIPVSDSVLATTTAFTEFEAAAAGPASASGYAASITALATAWPR